MGRDIKLKYFYLFIAFIIGALLPLVIFWYALQPAINNFFNGVEDNLLVEDMVRAKTIVEGEIGRIESVVRDYSTWDEMYEYSTNPDPAWSKKNLTDWIEPTFKLNLCWVLNVTDGLLYSYQDKTLASEYLSNIKSAVLGGGENVWSGMIRTGDYIFLISASVIRHTDKSGPINGILIAGRVMDPELIVELSDILGDQLNFIGSDGLIMASSNGLTGKISLPYKDRPYFIQHLDDRNHMIIFNILNKSDILIRIRKETLYPVEAKNSINSTAQKLAFIAVFIAIAIAVILSLLVLKPLHHALRKSEYHRKRYANLLETLRDFIILFDLKGKILEANKFLYEKLGYKEEEVVRAVKPLNLEDSDNAELWPQRINEILGKGELFYESNYVTREGIIIPVEIVAKAIEYEGKKVIFVAARDISEREKLAEKEKENLNREHEERIEFLLAAAHELKTPLTAIRSSSQLLESKLIDADDQTKRLINNLRRGEETLGRRLEDIFDFAKVRSSTVEIHIQPANLRDAISEAVELIRPEIVGRKLRLNVEIPKGLPPVMIDRKRFQQILLNLIGNSIKFTPEGGTVTVTALRQDNNAILVEVQDTGIGISDEEQKYIFEPFYRGEGSKRTTAGLGLGLTIVQRLVELHGGKVWVKSKMGEGTSFYFTIPVYNPTNTS